MIKNFNWSLNGVWRCSLVKRHKSANDIKPTVFWLKLRGQTKLCHHPPPSTTSQNISTTTHHHPSSSKIYPAPPTTIHHHLPTAKTFFIRSPFIRITNHCLTATLETWTADLHLLRNFFYMALSIIFSKFTGNGFKKLQCERTVILCETSLVLKKDKCILKNKTILALNFDKGILKGFTEKSSPQEKKPQTLNLTLSLI